MKKTSLIALLLCLSACNAPAPVTTTTATTQRKALSTSRLTPPSQIGPQNFDYYLLNLSWSPEFCHSHQSAPECGRGATFVLHGLWPQNADGSYPQNCNNVPGPVDPSQYSDIYPDAGLLRHEWRTHGTCSGLSADAFFTSARKAFQSFTVPSKLSQLKEQISLPPEQILSLVAQSNPAIGSSSLALSCGNNYLTAVEVCLDKKLQPIACGTVRSCRARTVRIPPP